MSNRIATSALERAITYLHAVEVAPGWYAVQDRILRSTWYTVSADDLARVGHPHGPASRFSLLEAAWALDAQTLTEMPRWWRPERRFAWRIVASVRGEEADPGARYTQEPSGAPLGYRFERITADLETGAEVPA